VAGDVVNRLQHAFGVFEYLIIPEAQNVLNSWDAIPISPHSSSSPLFTMTLYTRLSLRERFRRYPGGGTASERLTSYVSLLTLHVSGYEKQSAPSAFKPLPLARTAALV